jgi:MFS family permease
MPRTDAPKVAPAGTAGADAISAPAEAPFHLPSSASHAAEGAAANTAARTLFTRDFRTLIIAQMGFGYAFSSFFLLPTYLERELGASATQIGWVVAAGAGPVIALLPLAGHATDRFGRRALITLGGAIMAAACLGFLLIDRIGPWLFALRVIQALAFSMNFAAGGALAVDLAPPGRTSQAIGIFGLAFLAMNGVASASVERIAGTFGWDGAFGSSAAAALVCCALSLRIREPNRGAAPAGASSPEVPAGSASSVSPASVAAIERAGAAPRVRHRILGARVATVMAAVGLGLGAMFSFAQLYGAQLGATDVSVFFVAYATSGVIVRAGFGHLLDRWGPARVCRYALFAYTAIVAGTIRLDAFGLLAIGGGLGLAHGVFYPSYTAVALGRASHGARSRVIAYVQAAFSAGVLSSAGLGIVADRLGYPAVFAVAATAVLGAFLLHVTDRSVAAE